MVGSPAGWPLARPVGSRNLAASGFLDRIKHLPWRQLLPRLSLARSPASFVAAAAAAGLSLAGRHNGQFQ